MRRVCALAVVGLVLMLPVPAQTGDLTTGHWKVTVLSANGNVEENLWILNLETSDAKTTATLVAAHPQFRRPSS